MREVDQIPRNSLAWLLLTQAFILAPHASHVPLWIWAIWLFVVCWRWQIFRGAWDFPAWSVKFFLVFASSISLYFAYRGSFGMQTMVALLVVGFILKLVEMRKRNDLLLLCYLGYFVIATQFLFFSNLFAALYGVLSLLILTATLLAANQSIQQSRFWRTLRIASLLVLQAAPLMLVLFLVAPRVGALWSVPMNTGAAKTGMSDSMSPGDISQLAQSDELVFRATFTGAPPPQASLYWRGLVFTHFDGRSWTQSSRQIAGVDLDWQGNAAWRAELKPQGNEKQYQIIIEPTLQPWLLSLAAPRSWSTSAGMTPELTLARKRPIDQQMQYRVTSALDYDYQVSGLSALERRRALQLPDKTNPQTRAIAHQWRAETPSDEALVKRLLQFYHEKFRYTLQPPGLGTDSVDEFLWQSQSGFCEHFSGSFVFFMRAAGIPARVVVGYQGGEFNALENYYAVRQRDAHAWAEIWLPSRGWQRVDPTAAVAPQRIERGTEGALSEEDAQLLQRGFGGQIPLLNQLRLRWDALNYNWARWVLGYDANVQSHILQRLLGGMDLWRLVLFILLAGLTVMGGIVLAIMWRQRRPYQNPADLYYRRFCRKMSRIGYTRQTGEAPRAFATRIADGVPDLAAAVERVTQLYEWAAYAGNLSVVPDLRRAIKLLPTSVPTRSA